MAINYCEKCRVFQLNTPNTSYMLGVVDEEGFIGHVYYGPKLDMQDLSSLMRINENPFVPSKNNRDRLSFYDSFPAEYPGQGLGDFRDTAIAVHTEQGHSGVLLTYVSHKIYAGKPKLLGLPATFGSDAECTTLEILCRDTALSLEATLIYTVFEDVDAITRSVVLHNASDKNLYVDKVLSACLSLENDNYDMITLHGSWARERHICRREVAMGRQSTSSMRGEPGHQDHPFMAILSDYANEDVGEVYGMHFVYSGNFIAQVERNQFNTLRLMMGINPDGFCWKLEPGESFTAPEVVHVYSNQGLNGMTHVFHDLYRNHLIRGSYKDKKRPILINNWEATYFDFNTEKLLDIAREAAQVGIEMLVMDDGWFGNRFDDNRALGDWFVNEEKLPGGLPYLVSEVNKLGMKFGIWFEPEMISPESKLFEAHPDWAIQIPGRQPGLCRCQYVLDLTRPEVREYVWECLSTVLHSANIEYVKWDMNRQLSDIGSIALPADRQGELYHRYVMGMYELQERLITEFPNLLLENCSGGGARFDPGMLYYSPQIWCSDDTDAIERLMIQQGTALIYPLSSMGAHVSVCPNHTVGRVTPFETRGYVALAGTFGYELDITKLSDYEKNQIPEQVAMYHKYNDLVRTGDYYRIAAYQFNRDFDCYEVVSKDRKEALVTYVQVMGRPNYHSRLIKLKGLEEHTRYRIEETGEVYTGGALMHAGFLVTGLWGDFQGKLFHVVAVNE